MKLILNFYNKYKGILLPAILIGIFIFSALQEGSLKQAFEYNPDEGIDSIKSLLYLQGYSLYKEIWSDQPPLFTVILSWWFKFFGLSIYHARVLILAFSTILLWALYQTIKNLSGNLSAGIAVIFLLLSTMYARLSVSVMIGIPALSLAMLSIYCISLYRKNYLRYLLILSGFFMALSLQAKFFTAFLIPLIFLEIICLRKRKVKIAFLWLGTILSVYLTITIIFFYPDFHLFIPQLFKPHLIPLNLPCNKFPIIYSMLLQDYDIALLALLSIILGIRQKKRQICLPFTWLLLALFILSKHRPVWDHYYLLISIPICWLAAIRINNFFINHKQRDSYRGISRFLHRLTAGVIILTIINLPVKFDRTKRSISGETTHTEQTIINLLEQYKSQTHWIVTDMPIFAFYIHLPVPPEIAVATVKRRFSNGLSPNYFIDILNKYKPEQILLGKFQDYPPEVTSYIDENYINIHQDRLSRKMQNHSFYILWNRKPLGEYLPHSMRFGSNKRFYNLIWNSIYIPQPTFTKKQKNFYIQYTDINLFIRKDIIAQNQLKKNLHLSP